MIPDRFDNVTSSAERRVFERLRSDPDTYGWTALHSLALSRRGRRRYGEIDFVVLVPDVGIVCLEVKGGRVSCTDGVWRTRDRFGYESELTRSPFQQAREGMFALRSALRSHFGETDPAGRALIAYAVIFPDVASPPATTEFEVWEAIDIVGLRQPISAPLRDVLRHQRDRVGPVGATPDSESLRRIRMFLRPDFDIVIARSSTIERSEQHLLCLTEEQYEILDSLQLNERCVVEGAAGTGKTMLALELARRSVAAGRSTLLLCFNRLLGTWISAQAEAIGAGKLLVAGSYHRLLRDAIVASPSREEFCARESAEEAAVLFDQLYPFYGELALAESEQLPQLVIVDEAQDLADESALAVLNAWTRGGLAGGRWAMLGDFTRQALYSWEAPGRPASGVVRLRELLSERAPHHATLVLRRNCRNTRPIGEETALLSGFDSLPYRLPTGEGLPVDYRWWRSAESQVNLLRSALSLLRTEGVNAINILVLSPHRFENSAAAALANDPDYPVAPFGGNVQSRRRRGRPALFSTIQSFKGMESQVVILCDIDRISGSDAQAMLYVGMSRARSHLIVLLHERLRPEMQAAVERRLKRGWSS